MSFYAILVPEPSKKPHTNLDVHSNGVSLYWTILSHFNLWPIVSSWDRSHSQPHVAELTSSNVTPQLRTVQIEDPVNSFIAAAGLLKDSELAR